MHGVPGVEAPVGFGVADVLTHWQPGRLHATDTTRQ